MAAAVPDLSSTLKHELDLRTASQKGDEKVVLNLLNNPNIKLDVNAQAAGKSQRTALHWSAEYGHANICTTLLAKGAKSSLSIKDSNGHTPYELARVTGDNLKKGIKPPLSAKDPNSKTLAELIKDNEAVLQVFIKWSGLTEAEERKKVVAAVHEVPEPTAFNANKVKPAIHSLKKYTLVSIKEIDSSYNAYKALIMAESSAIKNALGKTLASDEALASQKIESKLEAEFSNLFLFDTTINQHITDLQRISDLIEILMYMDTHVVILFVEHVNFKNFMVSKTEQLTKGLEKFVANKKTRKEIIKNVQKMIADANKVLDSTITTMERGLTHLLENPTGFIEFINKYFPGDLVDYTDLYKMYSRTDQMDNASIEDRLAFLQTKLKGVLANSTDPKAIRTTISNIMTQNSVEDIARIASPFLTQTKEKYKVAKTKILPRLELYFKDLREQFVVLIGKKREAILKYNAVIGNKFGTDSDISVENFKLYIMGLVDQSIGVILGWLRDERLAISTFLLRSSYLFGHRLYSKIEHVLNNMNAVIDARVKMIFTEECKLFNEDIEKSQTLPSPTFEEVNQRDKKVAKDNTAKARELAANEREGAAAVLQQKESFMQKQQQEALQKEAHVKGLLEQLNVKKDSKILQDIADVLNPKGKAISGSTEMSKSDFFTLVTALKISGYEDINVKKNTASENSITFVLGKFHKFTYHSRHGKDRSDFVDKANVTHLKNMFESVGLNAANVWALASKYSKKEPVSQSIKMQ